MCNDLKQYQSVVYTKCGCGEERVRHARLDMRTRRLIFDVLAMPEPSYDGPWCWEEMLLLGVSELLLRREEERVPLF